MRKLTFFLPAIVLIIISASLNAQNRTELLKYKNRFLKQVSPAEHGYSFSYYEIVEQKDFPKKVELNLHGGNEYMLIVHGLDTSTHRLKGSPNISSGNFRSIDVEGYICSKWVDLTKVSIPVSYTFTIDADKDVKSKDNASSQFFSGLGLENNANKKLNPMIIFLVIYKSKDNKVDASGNKKENYYTQQNNPKSSPQSY